MTFLEAASAGVVQGITEFLPVSSSGHLVLLHALFGLREPQLLFDLCLHLGTTVAVLILFWRKILRFLTTEKRLFFFVILGSIPTAVIGALFAKTLESFFNQPKVVGFGFWITAVWLFLGERFRAREGKELVWTTALLIGVSQGIAIVPGISRSGATISTGLLLGLKGSIAVEYSFLLSIPAIVGAFLYKMHSAETPVSLGGVFGKEGMVFAVGILMALVFGLFAIQVIRRLVEKRKLYFFSLYLVIVGALTFLFFGKTS